MKNSGFVLTQVVVASGLLIGISLAIGSLMTQQAQSMSYFEDQFERVQLAKDIEYLVSKSGGCSTTFLGVHVPDGSDGTQSSYIPHIKNASGQKSNYESNVKVGSFMLGQMELKNISVPGASSSGMVELSIPIDRTKQGGGPQSLKPIDIKVMVSTDADGNIDSCTASAMNILESGSGYDGQTGHAACASVGKTCSFVMGYNTILDDAGCGGASHCVRVCTTWYNQSLPGIPNSTGSGASSNNNVHSCNSRVGFYTTYLHVGVLRCGGYFSAVCF